MSRAQASGSTLRRSHRAVSFMVFLISGLTLFLLQFVGFNSKSRALGMNGTGRVGSTEWPTAYLMETSRDVTADRYMRFDLKSKILKVLRLGVSRCLT